MSGCNVCKEGRMFSLGTGYGFGVLNSAQSASLHDPESALWIGFILDLKSRLLWDMKDLNVHSVIDL